MSLERFERLVGSYGADMSRWPKDEREQAERTLSRSEQAWAALGRAARLDRALDTLPPVAVDARTVERLVAGLNVRIDSEARAAAVVPASVRMPSQPIWPSWWIDAGLYAAMGVLGLVIGLDRVGAKSVTVWSQVASLVDPIARLGL